MNDVFAYLSSGVLTLEVVAWSNVTTRATALVTQDGVLVKSGATNKRYIGSFYCTTAGNGQTVDSTANRFIWNYYNRVGRKLLGAFTANRTTTSAFGVEINTEIRVNFCIGVSEEFFDFTISGSWANDTNTAVNSAVAGLDGAANAGSAVGQGFVTTTTSTTFAYSTTTPYLPGIGLHYVTLMGGVSAGTGTWYGDAITALRNSLTSVIQG
jgi:hypothetical protein